MWNMIQSILISMQSAILLVFINRTNSLSDAGIFSIAYAVASLIYYLGEYGVRKYQVTDVNELFSFSDYYTHRLATCALAILITFLYTAKGFATGQYSLYKAQIVIAVCIVKILEAYCDVYFSRFQQKGRLDVAAKASTYRIIIPLILCIISLVLTQDMILSMWIWVISTVLAITTSFVILSPEFGNIEVIWNARKLISITTACFPLFIGNFLLLYIGNAPKYAIDAILTNEDQACYNFIFMPVFVIGMLANFVFNPILMELAEEWSNRNYDRFFFLVKRQSFIIIGITALAIFVALTIGCPVLGLIFHADLSSFVQHLSFLMLGGGLLAFVNFLAVVITVLRGQRYLVIGYISAALAAGLVSKHIVLTYGLWGACVLYTSLMIVLTIIFAIILAMCIRKGRNAGK